jgi:SPRY domain-containing SOCS box protein 1/4
VEYHSYSWRMFIIVSDVVDLPYDMPYVMKWMIEQNLVSLEEQWAHAWDSSQSSSAMSVLPDRLTVCRSNAVGSTDGIRGKGDYTEGLHAWQIDWPVEWRGSHATVGVCTPSALLTSAENTSLVGINTESWGWDIASNELHHGGISIGNYPHVELPILRREASRLQTRHRSRREVGANVSVGETFYVALDMDAGTLSFVDSDNQYLGTAFDGLDNRILNLSLMVGVGHPDAEIKMTYLGQYSDTGMFWIEWIVYGTSGMLLPVCV